MDMMLGKGLSSTAPRESIELTPVEPELVGQLPGGRACHVHQTGPRDAPGRLVGGISAVQSDRALLCYQGFTTVGILLIIWIWIYGPPGS